ncbi:MAG TPA: hypothetical protein VJ721_07430 [Chthoniobacterales bacterium]|nr:hypothetical protein [Chthoniobacterales bacterium]
MKFKILLAICLPVFCAQAALPDEAKPASLDDLKKLDIICFVPSYLPKDFKFKSASILYEDDQNEGRPARKMATYGIEWSGPNESEFSIDSAWEGIGDRNLMETEDSEDGQFDTSLFGTVYFVYTPKGTSAAGTKKEIRANWVEDANMKAEKAKGGDMAHPVLGRFHGFTGTNMTVADFEKIINSLHPIKDEAASPERAKETGGAPELKLHPKIFNLIDCWLSDSESPVVTEINLDAVDNNGNEFNDDGLKQEGQWTRAPNPEGQGGFMMFRVLENKGNHYKVQYDENGGGSLTTSSIIEFTIDKRTIQRDGKPLTMRVLRVTGFKWNKPK